MCEKSQAVGRVGDESYPPKYIYPSDASFRQDLISKGSKYWLYHYCTYANSYVNLRNFLIKYDSGGRRHHKYYKNAYHINIEILMLK